MWSVTVTMSGIMEKQNYPSWRAISTVTKLWVICILLGPLALALVVRVIPPSIQATLINVSVYALIIPIQFAIYLAFRWVMDRGGSGWLWHLEFFLRRLVAMFSSDQGGLWIKWARVSDGHRIARAMVEMSAKCGNPEGLYEWGTILKNERMEDSALDAFFKAAQKGHLGAAWEVGEAARWGSLCMQRDRMLSRKWHEVAARNGYVPSIRILATALETGDGMDCDLDAAQRWQKRLQKVLKEVDSYENLENLKGDISTQAYEKGQKNSIFSAIRFLLGFANALVSRTPQGAVQATTPILFWGGLLLAVSLIILLFIFGGIIGLMLSLPAIWAIFGLMWMHKNRYKPNRELISLEKRATRGETEAMYELGMLYRNGSAHLPQDLFRAREWLLKASIEHAEAMLQAGVLLAWGYGGPKDAIQAKHLFQRAKSLGKDDADIYLQRMGSG